MQLTTQPALEGEYIPADCPLPIRNPLLRNLWTRPARVRVLHGGRASGKTRDAGAEAILLARTYKIKMLCTRRQQNRISESVYAILKDEIDRRKCGHEFKITNNSITHLITGSTFIFMGLLRNILEIKGLEGLTHVWLEEAEQLTEEEFDIISPTVREELSELWIIFNPHLISDFVWKNFVVNPPANTIVQAIQYTDNPYLSATILADIMAMKAKDIEKYNHIYLGQPVQEDDRVLIKMSWLLAAVDAFDKLDYSSEPDYTDPWQIGFDIADSGEDACATISRKGSVVYSADSWEAGEHELLKSAIRVFNKALATERYSTICYDSIGVGASAGSKFRECNEESDVAVDFHGFNAGGKVENPDKVYTNEGGKITNQQFFSNIKAQMWWHVADRLRNTYIAVTTGQSFPRDQLISIKGDCPHLQQMLDELATPFRDFDKLGKVKVESKQDLAKRGIKSPNLADAFIMAFVNSNVKRGFFDL